MLFRSTRVTVLGHIQRGGAPSARDRAIATHMGYEAAKLLAEGKSDRVVCMENDEYVNYDIDTALAMQKTINEDEYTVMCTMIGQRN